MTPLGVAVAAVQGLRVRRRAVTLPEAAGPTHGLVPGTGSPVLRLAVLGESTAAGCGAPSHDLAFAGALARDLSRRCGRPVEWQVHARNGATARAVRHRLLRRLEGDVDYAVLLAGVNDVLARRPVHEWEGDVSAILEALRARAGHVAMTGLPPFEAFPVLPRTLARFLAERATRLDESARRLCARSCESTTWIDSTPLLPAGVGFFAPDGFHPSSQGYARWAALVGERLTARRSGPVGGADPGPDEAARR